MIQIDSTEAFKLIEICLMWAGLFSGKYDRYFPYNIYRLVVMGLFAFLYILCVLINIFLVKGMDTILNYLSVGLNLQTTMLKAATIFILRSNFFELSKLVTEMDKRLIEKEDKERLRKVIRQCKRIVLIYFTLYLSVIIMFTVNSLITRKHLPVAVWMPFDWKSSNLKFAVAQIYLFTCSFNQVLQCCAYDSFPTVYMKVLSGHMKALINHIQKIGESPTKNSNNNYSDLVSCIMYHQEILKYLDIIKPIISWVYFYQLVATTVVLCLSTSYILLYSEGIIDVLSAFFYLSAVILQSLPTCYFVDQFLDDSNWLTTAIYNCNWIDKDMKFKKSVIIFMLRTQTSNTILAGKLVPVSLMTFVGMVKFSYSLFAILSQMKD